MTWQASVFLALALSVAGGFWWYERAWPSARMVALVAALAALAVAGRLVLAPIPNVVATTDIALITGYALGGPPGFAVGALAAPISNIWLGQGPWTVWQMAGWGLVGLGGAWLAVITRRRLGRFGLAAMCALAGLAYGALLDLSVMVTYGGEQSLDRFLALSVRGIPFNVAHAIGNVAIALAAGPALVRMISRYRTRFEFSWPSPAAAVSLFATTLVAATALVASSPTGTNAAAPLQRSAANEARGWLIDRQNSDGGFGASLDFPSSPAMTGWVMLSLEAAGTNPLDVTSGGNDPVDYLRSQIARLKSVGDLERTILALVGAGIDPREFAGKDLVADLREQRDGDGSVDGQTNLTAFYVLAMRAVGAEASELARSARWLRRAQGDAGGWGFQPQAVSDPDTTGAVVQALAAAGSGGRAADAGARWLRQAQRRGGGYALSTSGAINTQSTAWAVQGLVAAGGGGAPVADAIKYLDSRQVADGHYRYSGSSDQTPIWVTAQALLAVERQAFPISAVARKGNTSHGESAGQRGGGADTDGAGGSGASNVGSSVAGGSGLGAGDGAGSNSGNRGGGGSGGIGGTGGGGGADETGSGTTAGPGSATSVDVDQATTADEATSGESAAPAPAGAAEAVVVPVERSASSDDGVSSYLIGAAAFVVLGLGAGFVWYRDSIQR